MEAARFWKLMGLAPPYLFSSAPAGKHVPSVLTVRNHTEDIAVPPSRSPQPSRPRLPLWSVLASALVASETLLADCHLTCYSHLFTCLSGAALHQQGLSLG